MSVWACEKGMEGQHTADAVLERLVLWQQLLTSRIEVLEGRKSIRHSGGFCDAKLKVIKCNLFELRSTTGEMHSQTRKCCIMR